MLEMMIRELKNNDGLTLKNGKVISYKSGWQVATEGIECTTVEEALNAIKSFNFTAGVWYSEGRFFIDKSFRVSTKKEAIQIGKKYNQISILKWSNMSLLFL